MTKKSALLGLIISLASTTVFAEDIVGRWKTIDDASGFSRAVVQIYKNADGTYSGKIIEIRQQPGKPIIHECIKCQGQYKNQPLIGLPVVFNFKQNPNKPEEYIDGRLQDALTGKQYRGTLKVRSNGKKLLVRGYIGISALGRTQTWVRAK